MSSFRACPALSPTHSSTSMLAFDDPQLNLSSPSWHDLPARRDLRVQRDAHRHMVEQLSQDQTVVDALSRGLRTRQGFDDSVVIRRIPTLWKSTQPRVVHNETDAEQATRRSPALQVQRRLPWPTSPRSEMSLAPHVPEISPAVVIPNDFLSQWAYAAAAAKPVDFSTIIAVMPPVLQEYIPKERLPSTLMVQFPSQSHVLDNYEWSHGYGKDWCRFLENNAIKFEKVNFKSACVSAPETGAAPSESNGDVGSGTRTSQTAHLSLSESRLAGEGKHSVALVAPLELPADCLSDGRPASVSVVCKIALTDREIDICDPDFGFGDYTPAQLLASEARLYDEFPRSLQEEWVGVIPAKPDQLPEVAHAAVPKYYGYYKVAFDESAAVFEASVAATSGPRSSVL